MKSKYCGGSGRSVKNKKAQPHPGDGSDRIRFALVWLLLFWKKPRKCDIAGIAYVLCNSTTFQWLSSQGFGILQGVSLFLICVFFKDFIRVNERERERARALRWKLWCFLSPNLRGLYYLFCHILSVMQTKLSRGWGPHRARVPGGSRPGGHQLPQHLL